MKNHQITYRRNKNLGNYETEHVEISATVDENESPETAFNVLKSRVYDYLELAPDFPGYVLGNASSEDEINDTKGDNW